MANSSSSNNNIYTVLLLVTALALLAAIIYVLMRSMELFDGPFSLPVAAVAPLRGLFGI